MSATREQVAEALLAKIAPDGLGYATVGRRNRDPEGMPKPAIMLLEYGEQTDRQAVNLPPTRRWQYRALIYIDVESDETKIPAAVLNPFLDAIDAALVGDDVMSGRSTLGGLVYSALVSGETVRSPGEQTGLAAAIVPIEVIVP